MFPRSSTKYSFLSDMIKSLNLSLTSLPLNCLLVKCNFDKNRFSLLLVNKCLVSVSKMLLENF